MNKFFKKLAVVLSFVLVFTAMPMSVFAEGEVATKLPEAVNGVITLTENVELAETFTVAAGTTVTLDLNGKTISTAWADEANGKHIYAITNNGTLIIKDSASNGTINTRGIYNYGALTLESGTINAIDGNGGYAVVSYSGASFTMNGGKVATTLEDGDAPENGYDATTVMVEAGATFDMYAGEISNICNYTFAIYNSGTTTIHNGKVDSIHTTIGNYNTLTIKDGSFKNNSTLTDVTSHVVWAAAGTTTINGGTFDGKETYNGFDVDASAGAVVNINGGTFLPVHSGSLYGEGTINVYGGTFFDNPSDRVAPTSFVTKVGENWVVKALDPGNVTSEEELRAALEGTAAVIKLGASFEISEGIVVTRPVTLNLNTQTISAADTQPSTALIKVENAELIITGNGVIDSASQGNDYSIAVWARNAGAEVVIENGRFTNLGAKDKEDNGNANNNELIYASNGGKITIKDGEFIGNKNNTTHGTKYTLNITDNTASVISVEGGKYYDYDPADSKSENPAGNFVATGYVSVKEGEYWVVKDKASLEHKVEAEVPVIDNTKQEAQATVDTTANAGAVEAAAKQVLDVLNNENATDDQKKEAIDNLAIDTDAKEALKNAVDNKDEVTVIIEIGAEEMTEQQITAEQEKVDAIDSKLDNGETVAAYLDLSVTKSIAVNGVEIAGTETELTEIPQPLAFTVAYPKDVPAVPEGMVRVWVVYRAHGNEVTELAVTDNGDGTGVFHTDKFSVYALAYKDVPAAHEHVWGYNTQYDAAAHWDHCYVCGAQNTPVAHSDTNGDGICNDCGYVMVKGITSNRQNPNTGVTADMLK